MVKKRKIQSILIANRGEIAVRIIKACRELDIKAVALYSDADRNLPHVLLADEAYNIGPPPSSRSYLNQELIIETAISAGVDAIHPGYGFLAENPDFADKVLISGMVFIGPCPESIRTMGDKMAARRMVEKAGVPIIPGTLEPIRDLEHTRKICGEIGYPVLLKAAAGGGGKGMRVVASIGELDSAFKGAQGESRSAFGDDRIYIEKLLINPRHIEFQILADSYGNVIHLGERECSIQRRHQKFVEESPSPALTTELRGKIGESALLCAAVCNYLSAGTVEFLMDKDFNYYFLEMNTRIQVEHPVTELITGIDLVKEQIYLAQGSPLRYNQDDIQFNGHAIECRIYAEDPSSGFLPSTGNITLLEPAQGPGIREDRGVQQGNEITLHYDALISKLLTHGKTRSEALKRMETVLKSYQISGVTSNIPACLFVIQHPEFQNGRYDTDFINKNFKSNFIHSRDEIEKISAAIASVISMVKRERIDNDKTDSDHPVSRWKYRMRYFDE